MTVLLHKNYFPRATYVRFDASPQRLATIIYYLHNYIGLYIALAGSVRGTCNDVDTMQTSISGHKDDF